MSNFPGEGKITVSYFKFKAHVLKPRGSQAINQVFHKLMIITFQTRMSINAISPRTDCSRGFPNMPHHLVR